MTYLIIGAFIAINVIAAILITSVAACLIVEGILLAIRKLTK